MRRRWALTAVLAGAAGLLALLFAGVVLGFLYLAPALLLGAILLLGRFPGARRLVALLALQARRSRRALRAPARRAHPLVLLARGGRLVAARPGSSPSSVRTVSIKFASGLLAGSIEVRRGGRLLTPATSGLKPGNRRVVRAAFSKALAAGSYSVKWQATSGDGHRSNGSWSFTIVR